MQSNAGAEQTASKKQQTPELNMLTAHAHHLKTKWVSFNHRPFCMNYVPILETDDTRLHSSRQHVRNLPSFVHTAAFAVYNEVTTHTTKDTLAFVGTEAESETTAVDAKVFRSEI